MENKEFQYSSPQEAPLEYLREFIQSAPARVETEYDKPTTNSWVACFITLLQVVKGQMLMHRDELQRILSREVYQSAMEKFKTLEKRVVKLQEQYPKRKIDPPEEVKRELFNQVDIFS